MKPRAYVAHRVPGRIRFHVPERRHDKRFFGEMSRRMRGMASVTRVETNPATGSVLVEHDGPLEELIGQAMGADLGELVEFSLSAPPVAHLLRSETTRLDRAIREKTGGEVDLATVTSIGLFALAARQLFSGQQTALAISLAWYAAELLRRSGHSTALGTEESTVSR